MSGLMSSAGTRWASAAAGWLALACQSAAPGYLGQGPAPPIPQPFAVGHVTTGELHEFGSVFSADGLELYYAVDLDGRAEIRSLRYREGEWSAPEVVLTHERYSFNDPCLSPDGEHLYFISDRPRDDGRAAGDYDIWYVTRAAEGWGPPVNAGSNVNSVRDEYYVSFDRTGTLYFASNALAAAGRKRDFDLFHAISRDGRHEPARRLLGEVNTAAYEADVFVDRDGRYLIFSADRPGGWGRGDLYLSRRRADGSWERGHNLGLPINSAAHELCPFVSADGQRLFFTSGGDIYWVSTAALGLDPSAGGEF